LIDSGTGDVLGKKKILYSSPDAYVSKLVSIVVRDLLSDIPDTPPKRVSSGGDKWLYLEGSILLAPKFYSNSKSDPDLFCFGVKLGAEFRFLDFMSASTGAQITQNDDFTLTDFLLEVPIVLRFIIKLDKKFELEPFGGTAINFSLKEKSPSPYYSWFMGVQFGIKDKNEKGMIFVEPRFSMDFNNDNRYCIQLGFGYKFGLFPKRNNAK